MANKLVRFIQDQTRWLELKYPWLRDGEIPSDPLKDLTTSNNELSIYEFDGDESFRRIASAFAYTRPKRDKLDYIVFNPDELTKLGIDANVSKGETSDTFVNDSHRDLVKLSGENILKFAHYLAENGEVQRMPESELFAEIYKSLSNGWIRSTPNAKIEEGLKKWTAWKNPYSG